MSPTPAAPTELPAPLAALRARIAPLDAAAVAAARARSDGQAKPQGSLGQLEAIGGQLAGIAAASPPPVPARPHVVIAAADHGVHAQGVTPWPQDVTAMMVQAFCAGGAAVNALARTVGAGIVVLDVGVAGELPDHADLVRSRVRAGTRDLAKEDAMTADEVLAAITAGAELAQGLVDDGVDLLVLGDMGIANTTASAALIAAFTGRDAATVTGRGTGIDDDMLAHKRDIVASALARTGERDALGTLAALGGLEHAALVGVILAGAAQRVPVLLDGVISDAAALVAVALAPDAAGYLVAGHRSVEPGASTALDHLGLAPLVDLGLRLGEGTGALLAVPIVRAAAAALHDMLLLSDVTPPED